MYHFILIIAVCAEYNEGRNIVTENHFTDCQNYNPPCPNRYHSTEAYKCTYYTRELLFGNHLTAQCDISSTFFISPTSVIAALPNCV